LESSVSVTQKLNITQVVKEYGEKLKAFIRRRVRSDEDSDDILQEVYSQLAETDSMMKPIDHVSGWLFTVARNRITDLYRKKKSTAFSDLAFESDDESGLEELGELILELDDDPEDEYLQSLIKKEIESALNELPPEQRLVFELNEILGVPFKEISRKTGETVNTLISRKHYAVLHLRKRLQYLYDELLNS
jgi:RNA polymerase sigma factor (sigma-70 family)